MNVMVEDKEIQISIEEPELEQLLMGNALVAQAASGDGSAIRYVLNPVVQLPAGMSLAYADEGVSLEISLERLVELERMRPLKYGLAQEIERESGEPIHVKLAVETSGHRAFL